MNKAKELSERITEYMSTGGLMTPDYMDHFAVRDLLYECREVLSGEPKLEWAPDDAPQKYCPSENNAAYDQGFVDGMARQCELNVARTVFVERRPWVGLSDDEIEFLRNDQPWWVVRDIEAALKEKNS